MTPTKVSLTIQAVMVFTGQTDEVVLTLKAPSTFAEYGYAPTLRLSCDGGTGASWVRTVLGIEVEPDAIVPQLGEK
jgi:hypothetical protein